MVTDPYRHAGRRRRTLVAGGGLLATAVVVAGLMGRLGADTPAMQLGVPDAINQFVTLASHGPVVAAAWAVTREGGAMDIVASLSRDDGRTFSPPVRVNRGSGPARVNGEQPPRITLVPRTNRLPAVVVVWTAPGEGGTSILSARSVDGARSFSEPAVVPGGTAAGNRGWTSSATTAQGHTAVLWLDHRETAPATAGAHGHGHDAAVPARAPSPRADGVARAQQSQLYVSSVGVDVPTRAVARGVCYCCKTALVATGEGDLLAAWRHVYAGNRRDIAFSRSQDDGRTFTSPVRVSDDGWEIDGCPENGPTMAVDGARRVHIVWPTLVRGAQGGDTLRLFHAVTTEGGAFSPRAFVPTEDAAYHPHMVSTSDGRLALAWEEASSGDRRLRAASGVLDARGRPRFTAVTLGRFPGALYPAVAATADRGALVAWTRRQREQSVIALHRLPAP